jgi:hypothetical protein
VVVAVDTAVEVEVDVEVVVIVVVVGFTGWLCPVVRGVFIGVTTEEEERLLLALVDDDDDDDDADVIEFPLSRNAVDDFGTATTVAAAAAVGDGSK